jgi:hypothetical protein
VLPTGYRFQSVKTVREGRERLFQREPLSLSHAQTTLHGPMPPRGQSVRRTALLQLCSLVRGADRCALDPLGRRSCSPCGLSTLAARPEGNEQTIFVCDRPRTNWFVKLVFGIERSNFNEAPVHTAANALFVGFNYVSRRDRIGIALGCWEVHIFCISEVRSRSRLSYI